jgi:hypothetical protein
MMLLWRSGQPGELRCADVSPTAGSLPGMIVGGLWSAAALLFLLAAVSLVSGHPVWRPIGLLAALVSIAVLPSAPIALAGPVVEAAVLIAVTVAVAGAHRRPRRLDAEPR